MYHETELARLRALDLAEHQKKANERYLFFSNLLFLDRDFDEILCFWLKFHWNLWKNSLEMMEAFEMQMALKEQEKEKADAEEQKFRTLLFAKYF